MKRRALTDRTLQSLKPAGAGKTYDLFDASLPGFGVRVSETGRKTFVLAARYPTSKNGRPARRAIDVYSENGTPGSTSTLKGARAKAQAWKDLVAHGIDPQEEEDRRKQEQAVKRKNTFVAVAEDFISEKLPGERKAKEVEADIRREFLKETWAPKPIADVTDLDVLAVIRAKVRQNKKAQARNLLSTAKRLFAWAVDQRVYGLKASPCDTIKAVKVIGAKKRRKRVLSEDELFALWRNVDRMPYPHGPVYKLLILNALRLNEAADALRGEFRLRDSVWIIPEERMKGRAEAAHEHAVPLTEATMAVLNQLPTFREGSNRGGKNSDYVFSTTLGETPVWMTSKIKKRLDARMLRTLRAMARRRGDDPAQVTLPHWVNHDIRRTVRSQLSRLKVTEEAREAVLAHVRPGIKGDYDVYDYLDEKREALELWAARLRSIVEPAPANVVSLRVTA